MKCWKYFGAKRRGFIKSESILVPKGASHFKNENIKCDTHTVHMKAVLMKKHNC
jgi:hypothetical protein